MNPGKLRQSRGAAGPSGAGQSAEGAGRRSVVVVVVPPPPQGPRRSLGGGAQCLRRASQRRQRPSTRRGAYLSASRRHPAAAPAPDLLSRSPSFPEASCAMALALAALAAVEPACGSGYQQVSGPRPAPPRPPPATRRPGFAGRAGPWLDPRAWACRGSGQRGGTSLTPVPWSGGARRLNSWRSRGRDQEASVFPSLSFGLMSLESQGAKKKFF